MSGYTVIVELVGLKCIHKTVTQNEAFSLCQVLTSRRPAGNVRILDKRGVAIWSYRPEHNGQLFN